MLKKLFGKLWYLLVLFSLFACGDETIETYLNTGVPIPVEITKVYPLNNDGKLDTRVTFNWEQLENSEKYPWQIFIGSSIDKLVLMSENIEGSEYTITNLAYSEKYYWQIKCVEEDGNVFESDIWTFTTANEDGKVLASRLYESNIKSNSVDLSWTSVAGAERYFLYKSKEKNGEYEEILSLSIVIYYKTEWETTNIHFGNSEGWTAVPGNAMELVSEGEYAGWYKYELEGKGYFSLTFNEKGETWDSNDGNNYKIIESGVYELEANGEPKKVEDIPNKGFLSTEYNDSSLDFLTRYYYKVRAYDGLEMGEFSNIIGFNTTYFDVSEVPYLTWNKEDAYDTSIVVNYETKEEFIGTVEYGETKSFGNEKSAIEASHYQNIELNNLKENTKYYYRIKKDNGEFSEIYNFSTGLREGKEFNFILCSDQQDGIDYNDPVRKWEELANEIAKLSEKEKVDFIVMPGDFLANDRPENWKIFLDKGKSILPYIPMMPILGNHDTAEDATHGINSSNPNGTANFESHFALPGNEKNYVFKYQNSYFLALNTEVLADIEGFRNDEQYEWAKDKIENEASSSDWVFSFFHIPAYTILDRHGEQQTQVREITDFFDRNVDWVFSGHVHSYQRFKPLQYDSIIADNYGRDSNSGVGYMNLPPAGNYPEVYENNDDVKLAYPIVADIEAGDVSEIGFARVKIKDKNIDIEVFGLGTLDLEKELHVIDSVSYTK